MIGGGFTCHIIAFGKGMHNMDDMTLQNSMIYFLLENSACAWSN